VSGPFHSALLEKASQQLSQALLEVEIRDIRIPYLTNVTGDYVRDKGEVRDLLSRQVCSPVRWQQSVERMIADGIDTFVEIGPGKTLSGFMKRINKDVRVINIDKCDDIEKLKEL
jgi:[acyl-carrier-protein] S-malonyltransferase